MARRVERLLDRFLAEEAERETGGFEPWLLEAAFGEQADSERPALEIDGWRLHGAIDRVDRAADGRALVLDYKLSGSVTAREKLEEEAKLQLPALPDRGRRALGRGDRSAASTTRCAAPRSGGRAGSSPRRRPPTSPAYGLYDKDVVDAEGLRGAARRRAAAGGRDRRPDARAARSAATPARAGACAATTSARPSATSPRSAAATGRR